MEGDTETTGKAESTEASELQKALNEDQSEAPKTEPATNQSQPPGDNQANPNQQDESDSGNKGAQADLYGPNFKQLIDPEPRSE